METVITLKENQKWKTSLLSLELRTLLREQHHLIQKAKDRPLNDWELQRTEEILNETRSLFSELEQLSPPARMAA